MSLAHLLNQSATYVNPNGQYDASGQEQFGSAIAFDCRFQRTTKTIMTADKTIIPIHGLVWHNSDIAIEAGAKITYDSQDYRVIDREDVVLGNGKIHHRELKVQRWIDG